MIEAHLLFEIHIIDEGSNIEGGTRNFFKIIMPGGKEKSRNED